MDLTCDHAKNGSNDRNVVLVPVKNYTGSQYGFKLGPSESAFSSAFLSRPWVGWRKAGQSFFLNGRFP